MADRPTSSATSDAAGVGGRRVLVCGFGVAGRSATTALIAAGADVSVTVDSGSGRAAAPATMLGPLEGVPPGFDLVVASPGFAPTHPVLADAAARGIEIWGEVEFAWRLRGPDAAPWLALTGTNGKTTTVHMLESILRAAGLSALAVGNVGESIIDAVLAGPGHDVLAVELSSQQLHFASIRPVAGALLNLAPDHLLWHGSLEAYELAKTGVWAGAVAIANADDARVAVLAPADAVPFTLGAPVPGGLGVRGGVLVSYAFDDDDVVLAEVGDVRPAGQHNVANALAASALARAHGVPPTAVAAGLHSFVPDPHRNQHVLTHLDVRWVDDSKATNPHAASASLHAYPRVVWVAGGQLKGVSIEDLVAEVADRLVAAVLLGQDREQVATALARHAPDVPVIMVDSADDGAMTEVVRAAAGFARPGDTVLLAPAAASYDMFSGFGARGDAFATAVRALVESP